MILRGCRRSSHEDHYISGQADAGGHRYLCLQCGPGIIGKDKTAEGLDLQSQLRGAEETLGLQR